MLHEIFVQVCLIKVFAVKHFGILLVVAIGLGSCSSAMDNVSSIGDREALKIGKSVTPPGERARLIKALRRMNRNHHAKALHEIAAR